MRRLLYQRLLDWKNRKQVLPIMLVGARQTGKTYLLKEFCKNEYDDLIYFNFDDNERFASFFSESLSPSAIVSQMEIYLNRKIDIRHTIFFFDEIQNCERAIASHGRELYYWESNGAAEVDFLLNDNTTICGGLANLQFTIYN